MVSVYSSSISNAITIIVLQNFVFQMMFIHTSCQLTADFRNFQFGDAVHNSSVIIKVLSGLSTFTLWGGPIELFLVPASAPQLV